MGASLMNFFVASWTCSDEAVKAEGLVDVAPENRGIVVRSRDDAALRPATEALVDGFAIAETLQSPAFGLAGANQVRKS
jgi:hypothetical protein